MVYRILLVDDEPYIVDGISDILSNVYQESIEIVKATHAYRALELLDEGRIDIVLLDIHMPKISGMELYNEIITRWKKCRVIFLTGYDDFEYVQAALRGGAVDYLLKTEPKESVVRAVGSAICQIDEEMRLSQRLERYSWEIDSAMLV